MKIIFLDIDGVIATPTASLAFNKKLWCIDPTLARLLRRICIECDAKLVISSTWRNGGHNWNTFADLLTAYNLEHQLVHELEFWKTPSYVKDNKDGRGGEINKWLEDWHSDSDREPISNYVILDDDSDFTPEQKEKHFVHCNHKTGITADEYRAVKKILLGHDNPSLHEETYA